MKPCIHVLLAKVSIIRCYRFAFLLKSAQLAGQSIMSTYQQNFIDRVAALGTSETIGVDMDVQTGS
jgi:predicted Rdx family selenoprotein